jgi:hypothetical protein
LAGVLGVCLAGVVHGAWGVWLDHVAAQQGAALFAGEAPLPSAHLRWHVQPLPAVATRCINCHAKPGSSAQASDLGGLLDAQRLLSVQSRRGGPAVAYSQASFCQVLREGKDPNEVVISSVMPQFAVDDLQCQALWRYLVRG